jgi:hypothetical protein
MMVDEKGTRYTSFYFGGLGYQHAFDSSPKRQSKVQHWETAFGGS